ncbi:peptidylprolyl isomerase [Draconibacterium sp.]
MVFKFQLKYILLLSSVVFLLQCTKTEDTDNKVIARVGEKTLTQNEIAQIIPKNIEIEDSALMANDYVRKWVKQELLIKKANENLTLEQKNLTKEIEEYRNSLIIYKYKNELMNQQMDTLVTKNQIEQYYNGNPDNFKLNSNIVKAIFVKIPIAVANVKLIKELIDENSDEGKNALREYCIQYAKSFDFFNDNWVNFDIVKNNIPGNINDDKQYLARNNQIELKDSIYYYLVNIQDYKLQNELAPIEYVENNIKNLILNKRKIDFLKQVEDNIYKEGVRQNKFSIYSDEKK